jgi:UDP-glucuronate decarboxylase
MVKALMTLMNSSDHVTGPINLGNPAEMTVLDLAQQVIKLSGSISKIVFRPLPADDPVRRRPDITLAKELLDWVPVVPLSEGLAKTVQYFKASLDEQLVEEDRRVAAK